MAETQEERERRLRAAMAQSLQLPPPNPNTPQSPTQPEAIGSTTQQQPQPDIGPPPPRIGYSLSGLTGVDRLMEKRKAYETADPESSIKQVGELVKVEPPTPRKGFKGRLKSIGEGALVGLAMSDPDRPLSGLGGAIGGATVGGVNPRDGAKLTRRFEMGQLDNDIARGLKLEQEGAQLGGMRSLSRQRELEPQQQAAKLEQEYKIANAKLEVERQKAAGLITKQEADRQERELDRQQREADRASREKVAADRITSSEKIASMRPSGEVAQTAKREAKINESAALYKKAEAMDVNAVALDEHIKKLADGMATVDAFDKEGRKPFESQIEDLKKQQQKFRDDANDLRAKGDAARADGESIPETTTPTTKYSGRTMSQVNLERYAKDKGLSVEDAKKKIEAQGVRVQ